MLACGTRFPSTGDGHAITGLLTSIPSAIGEALVENGVTTKQDTDQLFKAIAPLQQWLRSKSAPARKLERPNDPLAELPTTVMQERLGGQVVLVGYGRVGRMIADALERQGVN